jgi:hypothetical protein
MPIPIPAGFNNYGNTTYTPIGKLDHCPIATYTAGVYTINMQQAGKKAGAPVYRVYVTKNHLKTVYSEPFNAIEDAVADYEGLVVEYRKRAVDLYNILILNKPVDISVMVTTLGINPADL